LLRTRRVQKKISQMQLAMNICISTRHLSDMENNKSMSSKDMVLYLGQALDLPYRQKQPADGCRVRPHFKERALDSQQLQVVIEVLLQQLNNHSRYPALVLNSRYGGLMHNSACQAFLVACNWQGQHNALDLFFATEGLRPQVKNFAVVAPLLLARVKEEAISTQDAW
jgi:transcriptional regulator with XRE-family HTH domain